MGFPTAELSLVIRCSKAILQGRVEVLVSMVVPVYSYFAQLMVLAPALFFVGTVLSMVDRCLILEAANQETPFR